MNEFYGIEYIIANLLIALSENNKPAKISKSAIRNFGREFEKHCFDKNIYVTFPSHSNKIEEAIERYEEYFTVEKLKGEIYIGLRHKSIEPAKSRFAGNLSLDVMLELFDECQRFTELY